MTLHRILTPLSWLYGMGVAIRNSLFDCGILKSRSFDVPVIAVGNLAVGGTGKTPHVEHIVRMLRSSHHVAVLSRGYKRHTKGFVIATETSTANDIGDEPKQIRDKFPDITVAVDEDRCHGINQLISGDSTKTPEVIVLDDAFQHRYVKPKLSIALVEYDRAKGDRLMPVGRLREPMRNIKRTDVVVVTKCPDHATAKELQDIKEALPLHESQRLFFSIMAYDHLQAVFKADGERHHDIKADEHVLLVTGIANPVLLIKEVRSHTPHVTHLSYGDHHSFSEKDITDINKAFAALPLPRIIITTEKDAARLKSEKLLSNEVRINLYAQPIKVMFLEEGEKDFDQIVANATTQHIASKKTFLKTLN